MATLTRGRGQGRGGAWKRRRAAIALRWSPAHRRLVAVVAGVLLVVPSGLQPGSGGGTAPRAGSLTDAAASVAAPGTQGSGGALGTPQGAGQAGASNVVVSPGVLPARDAARAPLAEVEASISLLDKELAKVNAQVEASRDQLAIVEVDRAKLQERIALTQARIETLRAELAEAAIASYIQPRSRLLDFLEGERDLHAAARREGLLGTLVESNARAVDRLQQVRQDLLSLEGALSAAEEHAAQLHEQSAEAEAQRRGSATMRTTLSAVLAARVADLQSETLGQETGRAELMRVLTQADLVAEAAQAAQAREEQIKASRTMARPIDAWITSEFGSRWGRMHWGVDFESDYGAPIYAAKQGTVLEADWMSGFGLSVVIDHGGGVSTLYAHQSELNVRAGEWVERGELIGWVGTTGNSTGPHLHFEVHEGAKPVDPRGYLG